MKATRSFQIVLVIGLLVAGLSCDKGNPSGTTGNVAVTGVTVKQSTSILIGATEQLVATIAPNTATNKSVTWTSNNASVATVSATGLVTAVAAGSAMITATTADGNFTAQCAVTVTATMVGVTGVTVKQSASIEVGKTEQLTAVVSPSTATNQTVTWTSSNAALAAVSATGLVTAVAAGSATVTVKTADGNFTAQCAVTVTTATVNNGTVTDIDGNVYHTVKIGNQEWTVENLRVTKLNDGTAIPLMTDREAWGIDTLQYCYYEGMTDADSIKKYGALYNWAIVRTGKLAPVGWHVPTDQEWLALTKYLITNGYNWDKTTSGNKIGKCVAATTGWATDSTPGAVGYEPEKNNVTGFSGFPGGLRWFNGNFDFIGKSGSWWSSTEKDAANAYCCSIYFDEADFFPGNDDKLNGFSVRLVKN